MATSSAMLVVKFFLYQLDLKLTLIRRLNNSYGKVASAVTA